jgi:hypothetical protein
MLMGREQKEFTKQYVSHAVVSRRSGFPTCCSCDAGFLIWLA